MKFLVDAQLPRRFCEWLALAGHDARHTLDLPMANRTTDSAIIELAERDGRVGRYQRRRFCPFAVVRSRLVLGKPERLLLVATGNISNQQLESLIRRHLTEIVQALESHGYVEIGRDRLVCHE